MLLFYSYKKSTWQYHFHVKSKLFGKEVQFFLFICEKRYFYLGTQKLESVPQNLENGIVKFSEKLKLETNLYLDEEKQLFLEKKVKIELFFYLFFQKSTFTVIIITPKG